jgi:TonB family protein
MADVEKIRPARGFAPLIVATAIAAIVVSSSRPAVAVDPTYGASLSAHVAKFRRYPIEASLLHINGRTVLNFRLSQDGRLISKRIVESSGDADLDRSALDTLERAQPFPHAPPSIPESDLNFTLPIAFKSRGTDPFESGDIQLAAYISGNCDAKLLAENLSCKYAFYTLTKDGKARFRIVLNDAQDPSREMDFQGSKNEILPDHVYALSLDRISVRYYDKPTKIAHTLMMLATGSCAQIGNFAPGETSGLSCSATLADSSIYNVSFKSDGLVLKTRRAGDQRTPSAQ